MPTDSKLKCRKVFVLPIEEFLRESTAEAQQQCVENNRYVYELFPVRSKVLPKLRESTKRVMMKSKIVEQTVRWLEKIGICVEYNAELQEFEFEYKGVCMIIHTDTPEGVLSFCCPYVFPDELSNENKIICEKAKEWWTKHIDTEHCFG